MRNISKRTLSLLCALVMVLSMAAMITPHHAHAAYAETYTVAELDALLSKTPAVHIQNYEAGSTKWGNTGSGLVDDADSVVGKAMVHDWNSSQNSASGTDMTNQENAVKIAWSSDGAVELGRVNSSNVIIDGEYHVYKMSFTIPEHIAASGMFYFFGTWQIQNTSMPGDLAFWGAGQPVDLYLSMKVEGEMNAATCYVDRVVMVEGSCAPYASDDGQYCTRCNKELPRQIPTSNIIADLNSNNFQRPYYGAFGVDKVVEDPASSVGTAARFSYEERFAYNNGAESGLYNAMIRTGSKELELHMVAEGVSVTKVLGISVSRLNANGLAGEYVVYKATNINLLPELGTAHYLMMFDCTGFRADLNGFKDQLVGKSVDLYLSLKVTGNVSNTTDNTPAYYIDRIVITEHVHEYTWSDVNETSHSGTCSCGQQESNSHSWNITVNTWPTFSTEGARTCTCAVCGYEKQETVPALTETNEDLAAIVAGGHEATNYLPSQFDRGSSPLVSDEAAYFGAGNAMQIGPRNVANGIKFAAYSFTNGDITIATIAAEDIQIDQGYQTYKLTALIPDTLSDAWGTYFWINGWEFALPAASNLVKENVGKYLDIYISMKVTGTLGSAYLYVDRMVFAESCKNYDVDGVCSKCGKTIEDEEVKALNLTFLADDFVRPYGDSIVDGAVVYSYAERYARGEEAQYRAMLRTGEQVLELRTKGITDVQDSVLIGGMDVNTLMAAGKVGEYITYKFENVVLPDIEVDIYMFDCWGFQLSKDKFADAFGKTVDVYLTMKITGDVTNAGDNSPTYYIQKIQIVEVTENAEAHEHSYSSLLDINDDVHGYICLTCGVLNAEEHSWDDGVVSVEPTYEADGAKVYTCSVCSGTKTETIAKLVAPAASWNLSLDGDISMNLHLNILPEQMETASVSYTVAGNTYDVDLAGLETDENGLPILTVELAAAQMTEEVTLTVTVGDETMTKVYTVRDYADFILSSDKYDEVDKNLVKNMLNYGAASQIRFNYNADSENLANKDIEVEEADVPTSSDTYSVEGSVNGLTFYGATLVHEDTISVRFYFTGSTEGIDFEYYEVIEKSEGLYYIEFTDICPQDLDEAIYFEISDGTNTLGISYAPMDYIVRMYAKEGVADNTKALVKALYNYYVAAEAYVAK